MKINKETSLMRYIVILAIIPIEYIVIVVDYYTHTMWGYLSFLLLIGLTIIYAKKLSKFSMIVLIRLVGGAISYVFIYLSSERLILTGYFKPFTTMGFSVTLCVVSIIVIAITYIYKRTGLN